MDNHLNLQIRPLDKKNWAEVFDLFLACSDYFAMAEDKIPDDTNVQDFFEELPPNYSLKDKILLGIYNDNQLIGVIDILLRYATEEEMMLGFLLLHPDFRRQHLGLWAHEQILKIAQQYQAKYLRIGVVTQNKKGLAFWQKLGYQEIKRTEPRQFGNRENIVIVMRLSI